MDGKWNDKWAIIGIKWMKYMSISDGKMDKSVAQHHPQTEVLHVLMQPKTCVASTLERLIQLFLHFTIHTVAAKRNGEFNRNWQSHSCLAE